MQRIAAKSHGHLPLQPGCVAAEGEATASMVQLQGLKNFTFSLPLFYRIWLLGRQACRFERLSGYLKALKGTKRHFFHNFLPELRAEAIAEQRRCQTALGRGREGI